MVFLEFTQDRIKLLEVRKKGKSYSLVNLSKKSVAGFTDEDVSNAILELFSDSGTRKRSDLVISVPRHLFTVRNLRLPAIDEGELRDMVALQVGKQLPYPPDEIVWDFKIIEKRPDGYSDVLLVLGHKNAIDRFTGILSKGNLEAERIILNSEALSGWYIAASGLKESKDTAGRIKAIVDIDASNIDVVVIKGEALDFSRSFPFKDNPEEMVQEIHKTFYSYQKDFSGEIASIVITGIEERAARLKPLLENMYEGKGVDFIHPLKVVSTDYRETMPDYFNLSRDVSFACLLGIVYNPSNITMDLLAPELKEKRQAHKKKKALLKTGLLVGVIALFLSGLLFKGFMDKRQVLNFVNARIKETEPKVKRLREISGQIELVEQNISTRGSAVDVLHEIFKIAPQGVSVSILDFELGDAFTVRGVSSDLSGVFKFASDLEKSIYFEGCQIKYAQKRVVGEKEFVDFEIRCKLARVAR